MNKLSPDQLVSLDNWSDISQYHALPDIDQNRLEAYRHERLRSQMCLHEVDLCVMVSPISLRYAVNYRNYALFMSHIPSTYLFFPLEGEFLLHSAFDPNIPDKNMHAGIPLSYMYGGNELDSLADQFALEVVRFLSERGIGRRRIAIEYVNPSITKALLKHDIEVVDGVLITEAARLIKSEDEIKCIEWAVTVAEFGADKIKQALKPGVTETQLWALLNYTNLANNGDWHDGRMLASGPRINPWLQEASQRKVCSGDLVGFDTDMIGPLGYFADLSRTFHCGPKKPTQRQKYLYQTAVSEIEHNLKLIQPGVSFNELREKSFSVPEEFHANAYPCIIHGVGMCDEYPNILPIFRGEMPYEGELEENMVLCIESYIGAVGEQDGVKLEQQVRVVKGGYELMTHYPYEECLM